VQTTRVFERRVFVVLFTEGLPSRRRRPTEPRMFRSAWSFVCPSTVALADATETAAARASKLNRRADLIDRASTEAVPNLSLKFPPVRADIRSVKHLIMSALFYAVASAIAAGVVVLVGLSTP
jgi:hypothetical protein